MPGDSYDLIVIGAGSAARDAANTAARDYGAKVALVEHTRWGGSCPNVACRPTKAYVVAAGLLRDINELAHTLGLEVGTASADLARIKARKDELLRPQESWLAGLHEAGFATFEGTAAFSDAHTVEVDGRSLGAERILVATGSRTAVPAIEGIEDAPWIDHVSALELTELPESLLVLGGGPVGLEFAQIFARFGSSVVLVQGSERIAPRADVDATAELTAALEEDGIEIVTGSTLARVRHDGQKVVAAVARRAGGATRELRISQLLLASGRLPNVEELALDRAGIETGRAGIVVDEHLRTTAPGVWAAGDVTGLAQFTPIAQYQARIAVRNIFTGDAPVADYSALPTVIFTDPELAGVGLTEDAAVQAGFDVGTATHQLASVTRAQYTNSRHGLFKIVFDRGSRAVLGIHVVSRSAGDIVQGLAPALRLGLTVDHLAASHHAYPTYGEGVKAAAERAAHPVATG